MPETAAEATVSWVKGALNQGGQPLVGRLTSVSRQPMCAGSGIFGELTRLRLGYNDRQPGDPESLVLKLPSRSPTNRARGRLFQLYERETRFYTELAPGLNLRVPRCYWAGSTRESDGSGLLLEDLAGMGTSDLYQGISAERARLAVQRLGVAHAQLWDCESQRDLRWIPRLNGRVMRQLGQGYLFAPPIDSAGIDALLAGKGGVQPRGVVFLALRCSCDLRAAGFCEA